MQPSIFDLAPPIPGPDVSPADAQRIRKQLDRVRSFLLTHGWVTLKQIAEACQCSEPSASARLRQLRNPKCGGWTVKRRKTERAGIFEYAIDRNVL